MPFQLDMARACMDFQTGTIINWPRPGGWFDQDEYELEAMRIAYKAYVIFKKSPSDWGSSELEFINWLKDAIKS